MLGVEIYVIGVEIDLELLDGSASTAPCYATEYNHTANNATPVAMPDPYFFEIHYLVILNAFGLAHELEKVLEE